MSRSSSRCLIIMTDSKLEKRVSSLSGNQTQNTTNSFNHTSSNSFYIDNLNSSRRDSAKELFNRDTLMKPKKVQNLKQTLKKKQEMTQFYKKELIRRRNRFQDQMVERQKILNDTINNLMSLIKIQVQKNHILEQKIQKYEFSSGFSFRKQKGQDSDITELRTSAHQQTMLLDDVSTPFARYF